MKVEIFDEKTVVPVPEKVLRLRLINIYGGTRVVAVDVEGKVVPGGHLLEIKSDGKLHRTFSVSADIGIPLDDSQRMCITGE